jgi:hypothetical protein
MGVKAVAAVLLAITAVAGAAWGLILFGVKINTITKISSRFAPYISSY